MPFEEYSLKFRIDAANPSDLQRISQVVQDIAQRTRVSAGEVRLFEAALKSGIDSGYKFERALSDVAKSGSTAGKGVASIARELQDFIKEQDKAAASTQRMGQLMERAYAENARRDEKAAAERLAQQRKTLGEFQSLTGTALPGGAGSSFATSLLGSGGLAAGIGAAVGYQAIQWLKDAPAALLAVAEQTGTYAREQELLANKTGFTIEQTQLFSRSAQIAGISAESLTNGLRTLSRAMALNSEEGRKGKQALKELGLDESVASLDPFTSATTIFSRLTQVPNQYDKERIATSLFQRQGLQFLAAADQFQDAEPRLRSAGAILDEDGIRKAAEYRRELELVKIEWESLKLKFGEGIIGTIEMFLDGRPLSQGLKDLLVFGPFQAQGAWIREHFTLPDETPQDLQNLAPGKTRPQIPNGLGVFRNQQAAAIQSYLENNAGGGDAGRRMSIERQLHNAQSDLATSIDKNDLGSVQLANQKVIALKQQLEALGEIRKVTEQVAALQDKAELGKYGKLGEIEMRRRATERGFDARERQNPSLTGLIERERGLTRKAFDTETIEEVRRTNNVRKRSLSDVYFGVDREELTKQGASSIRLAELQAGKNEGGAVEAGYQKRIELANELYFIDTKRIRETVYSENADENAFQRKLELTKAAALFEKQSSDAELQKQTQLLEIANRKKEAHERANKEIDNIALGERRGEIVRQSGRAEQLAKLNAQPGTEGSAVASAYLTRLNLAQQLFDLDMDRAAKLKNADEERVATAKAYADQRKEQQEAELQLEIDLATLRKKQIEEARDNAGKVFDALTAKGGGGLTQFAEGFGKQIERQIFVNLSEGAFTQIQRSIRVPGTTDGSGNLTGLGKVLRGTPLGASPAQLAQEALKSAAKSDTAAPLFSAGIKLDLAGIKLAAAADQLMLAAGSGGGVTGRATAAVGEFPGLSYDGGTQQSDVNWPGGIPGLATFGSDTNGLTGQGGFSGVPGFPGLAFGPDGTIQAAGGATTLSESVTASAKNSGFSNFGLGLKTSLTGGNFFKALSGSDYSVQTGDGTATTASSLGTAGRLGAIAGGAGAIAAGGFGVYEGIKQGGARGYLGAASAALGTAAALDPEPISKAALMIASIGTGLVKTLFGDPKQMRSEFITKTLEQNRYQAPVALSETRDSSGNYTDSDRYGNVRSSSLSAVPQVQQPYMDYRDGHYIPVAGSVTSPFGGGAPAPNITIQAMDAQSFADFAMKNRESIATAHGAAFADGGHPAVNSVRQALGLGA